MYYRDISPSAISIRHDLAFCANGLICERERRVSVFQHYLCEFPFLGTFPVPLLIKEPSQF